MEDIGRVRRGKRSTDTHPTEEQIDELDVRGMASSSPDSHHSKRQRTSERTHVTRAAGEGAFFSQGYNTNWTPATGPTIPDLNVGFGTAVAPQPTSQYGMVPFAAAANYDAGPMEENNDNGLIPWNQPLYEASEIRRVQRDPNYVLPVPMDDKESEQFAARENAIAFYDRQYCGHQSTIDVTKHLKVADISLPMLNVILQTMAKADARYGVPVENRLSANLAYLIDRFRLSGVFRSFEHRQGLPFEVSKTANVTKYGHTFPIPNIWHPYKYGSQPLCYLGLVWLYCNMGAGVKFTIHDCEDSNSQCYGDQFPKCERKPHPQTDSQTEYTDEELEKIAMKIGNDADLQRAMAFAIDEADATDLMLKWMKRNGYSEHALGPLLEYRKRQKEHEAPHSGSSGRTTRTGAPAATPGGGDTKSKSGPPAAAAAAASGPVHAKATAKEVKGDAGRDDKHNPPPPPGAGAGPEPRRAATRGARAVLPPVHADDLMGYQLVPVVSFSHYSMTDDHYWSNGRPGHYVYFGILKEEQEGVSPDKKKSLHRMMEIVAPRGDPTVPNMSEEENPGWAFHSAIWKESNLPLVVAGLRMNQIEFPAMPFYSYDGEGDRSDGLFLFTKTKRPDGHDGGGGGISAATSAMLAASGAGPGPGRSGMQGMSTGPDLDPDF